MLVMLPALLQSTQPAGKSRLTWLKTLKNWNCSWAFALSVIAKSLNKAKSVLKNFGPRKLLRPTLPNVSNAGCDHGPAVAPAVLSGTPPVVWNQYPAAVGVPEREPSPTEPLTLGRHGLTSLDGPHDERLGVKGSPLEKFVALLIDQPPMRRSAARFRLEPHLLPRPKGNR